MSDEWGKANLGRADDKWAPGQNADGEIEVLTVEEARRRRIERDAEEALDDDEAAEDAKLSKESVDYSPGKGESRCRNCQHYQGDGVCEASASR